MADWAAWILKARPKRPPCVDAHKGWPRQPCAMLDFQWGGLCWLRPLRGLRALGEWFKSAGPQEQFDRRALACDFP